MSIYSTGPGEAEPLVVKPKIAWRLLACSNTRGYELLSAGELESFLDGRSRKILVVSINRYIARRLAAEREAATPQPRPEAAGQLGISPATLCQWRHGFGARRAL